MTRDAEWEPARHLATAEVEVGGVRAQVQIDLNESPLAWLARRRGRDGKAFIDATELLAGERLRADFTRAQMTPRLSADWSGMPRSGPRGGGAGGSVSEAALIAKQRLSAAMEAVGPEFSGLLMDVCCFLKGMEQVEQERGWPARTAKVVLALGLARLARHYGISAQAQGPARGRTRAWKAEE